MDLLKALKRTTIISATALLALGATEARAADQTAIEGHISASIVGTLQVNEISAINFGNFIKNGACGGAVPKAGTHNADAVVMDPLGVRSLGTGCLTPVFGTSGNGLPGTGVGTHETGGQAPGFYAISGAEETNVYVSFANEKGDVVDANYGVGGAEGTLGTVFNHPNNFVTLTNDEAGHNTDTLAVNEFTFVVDDATGANHSSGYTELGGTNSSVTWGTDNSGYFVVTTSNKATLRVGGTLTGLGVAQTVGKYSGTFYVMVSY